MNLLLLNRSVLFLAASLLLFTSCGSAAKNVDQGDFDEAIDLVLNRMTGRKKIKTEWVVTLEEAFAKATDRDMAVVNRLKMENRAENWPKIYDVYRTIRLRQERISNYLPIISVDGRKADFRFVRVDALELEAKEKAAAYYYDRALELLQRAREGDRLAARAALEQLNDIDRYYQNYRQKASLKEQAIELGTTYLLIDVNNQAPVVLPMGFTEALLELSEEQLDRDWRVYHTRPVVDLDYDYQVVLTLLDLATTPDQVAERSYEQRATVEDGWEYVLDANGNVSKDSTGNDIKRPKEIEVVARVLEVVQTKSAALSAAMEVVDARTGARVDREELTASARFENFAATFEGDERALDETARKKIGNRPVAFPTDAQLMLEAAYDLRRVFSRQLRNNRRID